MRRSQNETSGIDAGMICLVQQESARRCTYHARPRSRGNTDLLTCVRERNAPAPTSYLLAGRPCNGELSSRRIAPLQRGLTRTAPFRVGIMPASLPILPKWALRNRHVLRYLFCCTRKLIWRYDLQMKRASPFRRFPYCPYHTRTEVILQAVFCARPAFACKKGTARGPFLFLVIR